MIVFSFPEFLAMILLLLALLAFLFRGWEPWPALVSSAVTGGLALWIWLAYPVASLYTFPLLPVGVNFGGRITQFDFSLHLYAANLPIVVMSLVLASLALLLAALVHQGDFFVPISLVLLLGYEGIALLQGAPLEPVLIIPILLAILSALGVFILQGDHFGQTGGPLRSMLASVLAFPFFLPVAWYVAEIPLNPQNNDTFQVAGLLLAIGLLLLLAPAPLHSGQPSAAQGASPVGMVLITLLSQLAILSLLYRVVTRFSFVVELAPLNLWLTVGGVVTAIWGGVAAIGASHPGRLWGYALLHNWGLILLILAVPGPESWPLVIFLFGSRAISALTAVAGLAQLREVTGRLASPEQLQGAGSRLPWSSAAFLLGGLGLAGFPLSAGFTGHWAALQIVADSDWRVATAVLIASGGVVFGFVRMVRVLFGPLQDRFLPHERVIGAVVAVIALIISSSMAIAPQLLEAPVTWALVAFTR